MERQEGTDREGEVRDKREEKQDKTGQEEFRSVSDE